MNTVPVLDLQTCFTAHRVRIADVERCEPTVLHDMLDLLGVPVG